MAGTWSGTVTVNNVTGGECMRVGFPEVVGIPFQLFPITFSQTGSDLSASIPALFSGNSCTYAGTVTDNTFFLSSANCRTLSPRTCIDGPLRDVTFVNATISGRVSGNVIVATAVESWNVFLPGTPTSVGVLTLTSTFNLAR